MSTNNQNLSNNSNNNNEFGGHNTTDDKSQHGGTGKFLRDYLQLNRTTQPSCVNFSFKYRALKEYREPIYTSLRIRRCLRYLSIHKMLAQSN